MQVNDLLRQGKADAGFSAFAHVKAVEDVGQVSLGNAIPIVLYAPSLKYSGRVSTLSVSYQKKSLTSPAKVRGKCHKTVTKSVCQHVSRRP